MSLENLTQSFSLAGKVAVVTGAASGLGRESARVLAEAGARVVLADIDMAGLEQTAALCPGALIQPTDVTSRDQVEALAARALADAGGLDVWLNSAGISLWSDVVSATPEQVDRIVSINQTGTYWGCAAAGRAMMQRGGGAIVNISSTAGESPVPNLSVYGMTKAAVEQLTRVCALEFGGAGVRVNAVVPGWIDTPINSSMYRDAKGEIDLARREEVMTQMKALSPLGLTGEALDIAMAVLYLASDASKFVTGQCLRVSGGV